jgi:hypothetical protein
MESGLPQIKFTRITRLLSMYRILSGITIALVCSTHASADVVYFEDFEDGVADNITVIFPAYEIGSGLRGSNFAFHSPTPPSVGQIFRIDGIPSDITSIEFDFVLESAAFGDLDVGFNSTVLTSPLGVGDEYAYGVGIHPKGSDSKDGIGKRLIDDGLTLAGPQDGVIGANEVHRLLIEHIGSHINVYLDDSLYMHGVDPGPRLEGGFVFIRLFGSGTIDNIRITAVPEPSTWTNVGVGGLAGAVLLRRRNRSSGARN